MGKIDPAPDFLTIGIEIDDEQRVRLEMSSSCSKVTLPVADTTPGTTMRIKKLNFSAIGAVGRRPAIYLMRQEQSRSAAAWMDSSEFFSKTLCRFL